MQYHDVPPSTSEATPAVSSPVEPAPSAERSTSETSGSTRGNLSQPAMAVPSPTGVAGSQNTASPSIAAPQIGGGEVDPGQGLAIPPSPPSFLMSNQPGLVQPGQSSPSATPVPIRNADQSSPTPDHGQPAVADQSAQQAPPPPPPSSASSTPQDPIKANPQP